MTTSKLKESVRRACTDTRKLFHEPVARVMDSITSSARIGWFAVAAEVTRINLKLV